MVPKRYAMDCRKCEEMMYLYAELTAADRAEIYGHLANCQSCSAIFAEIRALNAMVSMIAEDKSMPPSMSNLTHRVMEDIASVQPSFTLWSMLWENKLAFSMAAVSLMLVVTFAQEVLMEDYHVPHKKSLTGARLSVSEFKSLATRQKARVFSWSGCRTPLASAQAVKDCMKSHFKQN